MLIDKVKEIEDSISSQIRPGDGYVACQIDARGVLEMAQALIAVDDALKDYEELEIATGVTKEIRKAIEQTKG